MNIEDAYHCVAAGFRSDPGSFYDPGQRLTLGKGSIQREARFAIFNAETGKFDTAVGCAYILTHECDVDEDNGKTLSDEVLVCPIMPLPDIVEEYGQVLGEAQLKGFLANLGARNISRMAYLPPIPEHLPYGGVMFLNQITHSSVSILKEEAKLVCFLSGTGLQAIEYILENHLLRPKADRLAFMPQDWGAEPTQVARA